MQCSKKRVHKNIRGKEEVRLMDINQVLMDYDNMFGTHSLEDIEEFLTTNIEVAMDERDYASALSLLNEMISVSSSFFIFGMWIFVFLLVQSML